MAEGTLKRSGLGLRADTTRPVVTHMTKEDS